MQELNRLLYLKEEQALAAKQEKEIQEKNEEASLKAYGRATEILRKFGERHITRMGTGGGEGIVGMRFEQVAYLKTPQLLIETPSGNGQISLRQKIESVPSYRFRLRSLDIIFQGKSDSSPQVLFSIGKNEVTSVEGKVEGSVPFEKLNQVLSFLEENYEQQGLKPPQDSSRQIILHDFSRNF